MSTRLIADMCANHCGSRMLMESMIKAAASVGVDIAKFQSFKADKLRKDWPDYENAYRYYKQHELSESDHYFLMEKCHENKIQMITTVFDLETVDFLADLGLKQVKIASPDANNWALIDRCLEAFDHVIISTGLHTDEEIADLWRYVHARPATIMRCISLYPAPAENLGLIGFHGFSDHTLGTDAAKLAIALGADYVEKHFSLSPYLPGKDQKFAGNPQDFKDICEWRDKVKVMMGNGTRELSEQELQNRKKYIGRWSGA